jgi:hypothetical protein
MEDDDRLKIEDSRWRKHLACDSCYGDKPHDGASILLVTLAMVTSLIGPVEVNKMLALSQVS